MNIQDRVTVNNVYIKPDGQICACIVPVPEKEKYCSIFSPNYPCDGNGSEEAVKMGYCLCWEKMEAYEAALQACKDSSVPFENKEEIWPLLVAHLNDKPLGEGLVKKDTFYPLQCEVYILTGCEKCGAPYLIDPIRCQNSYCERSKVARLIPEAKGHGFCEKPGHVCTMNYCDENGCQERKRVLVPEAPAPSDFKTARKFERFTAKDKESIAPIVEESQLIIVTRKLQKNLEDYKRMRDGWKEGTHQYEAYALMVREYRKIIDMLLPIAITRKP